MACATHVPYMMTENAIMLLNLPNKSNHCLMFSQKCSSTIFRSKIRPNFIYEYMRIHTIINIVKLILMNIDDRSESMIA